MKRLFDILLSATALLFLLPLIIVIAILVRLRLGGPVLFRQERAGMHGQAFRIIKFRTMREIHDENGVQLRDAERLTGFGRLLRATSLDELPEFLNVVRGDMSLVGPRPLLMDYLPLYTKQQDRRHEVRPGITGWAQVNGRNSVSWEDRFDLDVWYVDNRSLWLDIKILFMTLVGVFRGDGISAVGEATMPRFTGSRVSKSL